MQLSFSIICGLAALSKCAMGATDARFKRYQLYEPNCVMVSDNEFFETDCEVELVMAKRMLDVHFTDYEGSHTISLEWKRLLQIESHKQKDGLITHDHQKFREFTIRGYVGQIKGGTMFKLNFKLSAIILSWMKSDLVSDFEANYKLQSKGKTIRGATQARFDMEFTDAYNKAKAKSDEAKQKVYAVSNVGYWTHSGGAVRYSNAQISIYKQNWTYRLDLQIEGEEFLKRFSMNNMVGCMGHYNYFGACSFTFTGIASDHPRKTKEATFLKFDTNNFPEFSTFSEILNGQANTNTPAISPDLKYAAITAIEKCPQPTTTGDQPSALILQEIGPDGEFEPATPDYHDGLLPHEALNAGQTGQALPPNPIEMKLRQFPKPGKRGSKKVVGGLSKTGGCQQTRGLPPPPTYYHSSDAPIKGAKK